MEQSSLIDTKSIKKISQMMKPERFRKFKDVALSTLTELSVNLDQAFLDNNIKEMHRSVHSIKSSAQYMGGLSIADQAQALENQFKNENTEGAEQAIAELQVDLKNFILELKDYSPLH